MPATATLLPVPRVFLNPNLAPNLNLPFSPLPSLPWLLFIGAILLFVTLDTVVFHRRPRQISFKEALAWTFAWFVLALLFAAGLLHFRGKTEAVQFFTAYFLELSLSVDNVLVIALAFAFFQVPALLQHRVLMFGVLGALIMRGLMIWLGVELVQKFDWVLYIFGAFLVVGGLRIFGRKTADPDPEKNPVVRFLRKLLPIAPRPDGERFFTIVNGRRMLTPLMLVLLVVEIGDLFFATDSIPAVFGVTRVPFIVFTSNVFAILGLRSLYFVLAGAMGSFRYLRAGVSTVLIFIGVKMLIDPHDRPPRWFQWDMPDPLALACVAAIIAVAVAASVFAAARERRRGPAVNPPAPAP